VSICNFWFIIYFYGRRQKNSIMSAVAFGIPQSGIFNIRPLAIKAAYL